MSYIKCNHKSKKTRASIDNEMRKSYQNENNFLTILNKQTKIQFIKNPYQYSKLDFHNEDNTHYIEFKHRYINLNTYNTTIIGINKIEYCKKLKKENKKVYFVFRFNEGYYYIRYRTKTFKNFNTKHFTRNDRDNGYSHLEIPVELLKPIEKLKI